MNLILNQDKVAFILRNRHPWIFRNAIRNLEGEAVNGDMTAIVDETGTVLGWGFYSPTSKIACRIFAWGENRPPSNWVITRLQDAWALRRRLQIQSNAYRLINAEGDFFPGCIIDIYHKTAVLKPLIRGVERLVPEIIAGLSSMFPGLSVYLKRDERAVRVEQLELAGGYVAGGKEGDIVIQEHGLAFQVDIFEGQKTGFYLDQRDNRIMLRHMAAEQKVLNLFSYTGAFALQALAGGARQVDSVDSSQAAVRLAEQNYRLNSFSHPHEARFFCEDAFAFLDNTDIYDIIILDPPPFARSRGEVPGALRGYRRLQQKALQHLSGGGMLVTFSCSGAVGRDAFRRALFEAARGSRYAVRIMRELHAASDHPCSLHHPEGEYLKGLMAYVG